MGGPAFGTASEEDCLPEAAGVCLGGMAGVAEEPDFLSEACAAVGPWLLPNEPLLDRDNVVITFFGACGSGRGSPDD